jgi:hypothetical protein
MAPKEKKEKKKGKKEPFALPPKVGYEDMTTMENMTLDGVLENLKDRYEQDLIYVSTYSLSRSDSDSPLPNYFEITFLIQFYFFKKLQSKTCRPTPVLF